VADGLTDAAVLELLDRRDVERHVADVDPLGADQFGAVGAFDLLGGLRAEPVDNVEFSARERLRSGGVLADRDENGFVDLRAVAPVVVVRVESDLLVGVVEGVELERPRSDRVFGQVGAVLLDGGLGWTAAANIARLRRNGAYVCVSWIVIS